MFSQGASDRQRPNELVSWRLRLQKRQQYRVLARFFDFGPERLFLFTTLKGSFWPLKTASF